MLEFKFKIGDRVDHSIANDFVNGTPGTVVSRFEHNGWPVYRIQWDDGYIEEFRENSATSLPLNIWPEWELIPLQ